MNKPVKIEVATSVYAKIAAVQGELAKVGISKSRKNQTPGQNYNFRGIDEIYNTLAPLMAEHGLCVLPRMVEHSLTERGKTRNGNAIFSALVAAEFDFVSAADGSTHTVRTYGEAMDSSDKATNKAMSAAYKYAALMTFAIPTEGDNDADAFTPEVVAGGHSQEDAVSPPPTKAPPKTHLDAAEKRISRQVLSCGDLDTLILYLETDEYKADKAMLEQHRPESLYGPPPANCPEYEPLRELVKRVTAELRKQEPTEPTNYTQGG